MTYTRTTIRQLTSGQNQIVTEGTLTLLSELLKIQAIQATCQ